MISGVRASPRQRHLAGRATRLAAALLIIIVGVIVRNAEIILEGLLCRKTVCQVRRRVGKKLKHEAGQEKKWNLVGWQKKILSCKLCFSALPVAACKSVFFLCVACIFCIDILSRFREICLGGWKVVRRNTYKSEM